MDVNPLSANPTKWSNKLKQFVITVNLNEVLVTQHVLMSDDSASYDFFQACV